MKIEHCAKRATLGSVFPLHIGCREQFSLAQWDEARNVHALQTGPGERRSFHPCPDLLGSVFLTEVEQHF